MTGECINNRSAQKQVTAHVYEALRWSINGQGGTEKHCKQSHYSLAACNLHTGYNST